MDEWSVRGLESPQDVGTMNQVLTEQPITYFANRYAPENLSYDIEDVLCLKCQRSKFDLSERKCHVTSGENQTAVLGLQMKICDHKCESFCPCALRHVAP